MSTHDELLERIKILEEKIEALEDDITLDDGSFRLLVDRSVDTIKRFRELKKTSQSNFEQLSAKIDAQTIILLELKKSLDNSK